MSSLGAILSKALAANPNRGQGYQVQNSVWELGIFDRAKATRHPGLVCQEGPTLAPGTSKQQSGRKSFKQAFVLDYPNEFDVECSTFFLAFRKYIPAEKLGRYIGPIHSRDLVRLNEFLDEDGNANLRFN